MLPSTVNKFIVYKIFKITYENAKRIVQSNQAERNQLILQRKVFHKDYSQVYLSSSDNQTLNF